jgi:hypothetical protein
MSRNQKERLLLYNKLRHMRNLSVPSFQTDYSSSKQILNNQSTSSSSSTSTSTITSTTTTTTTSTTSTNDTPLKIYNSKNETSNKLMSPCKKIRKSKSLKKELLEELLSRDNTTENSVISLSSLENKTNSEFPFLKGHCPLKKKLYSDFYSDDLIDVEKKIIDKQLKRKYKKQKCTLHSPEEKLSRPKAVAGIIAISLSPKKKHSDSFSLPDTSKLLKSTDSDKEKLRKLFSGTDLFDSASFTLDKTNTQQEKLLQEVLGSLTESLQEYEKTQESEKSQNSQESQESQKSLEMKQNKQNKQNLNKIKTESNNNSKKKSLLQNETQSLTLTETETPSVEITTTEIVPSESQSPVTMFDSVRKILGLQTK